jgi:prepilin-type processing-associated H-X9-DG protein
MSWNSTIGTGWEAYLLPYFEQGNLAARYDYTQAWNAAANSWATTTNLAILLCPSAPSVPRTAKSGSPSYSGLTDYSVVARQYNSGPFPALTINLPFDATFLGILGKNWNRKITEVTDGTSNTLLLIECAGRPQDWEMGKQNPNKANAGGTWWWADPTTQLVIYGYDPVNPTALTGPCAVNCFNDGGYSFHPGGCNSVFGDGSVHFLKSSLDVNIFMELVTRSGGEVVSSSSYE